jgi:exopolysaccharide production protein ExoZ
MITLSPPDRLQNIQMLRGIAAMLVVLQHSCWLVSLSADKLGSAWLNSFSHFTNFGAIGVDLFFIISGFVMALSASRCAGADLAGQFLLQRFLRIAPLLYVITLIIYAGLVKAGVEMPAHRLVGSFLIVPFFDVQAPVWPVHYFGWSLAFEFVFYFWVAALIATRLSARPRVLLALLCVLPLIGYEWPSQFVVIQLSTHWMMWEFALGVAAFMLWRQGYLQRFRRAVVFAAGLAFAVLLAELHFGYRDANHAPLYASNDPLQGLYRVIIWGLPCFPLFCFALICDLRRLPVAVPILLLLGDASYSIYLSQMLVYHPVIKWSAMVGVGANAVIPLLVAICALTGVLCYRYIENPMNGRLRRRPRESREARRDGEDSVPVASGTTQNPA